MFSFALAAPCQKTRLFVKALLARPVAASPNFKGITFVKFACFIIDVIKPTFADEEIRWIVIDVDPALIGFFGHRLNLGYVLSDIAFPFYEFSDRRSAKILLQDQFLDEVDIDATWHSDMQFQKIGIAIVLSLYFIPEFIARYRLVMDFLHHVTVATPFAKIRISAFALSKKTDGFIVSAVDRKLVHE